MSKPKIEVSAKGRRLMFKLMSAADSYAFLGAAHPEDHDSIAKDYADAQEGLMAYIGELERVQKRHNELIKDVTSGNL